MEGTGNNMGAAQKESGVIVVSEKRKTAIARATLRSGKGTVRINSIPMEIFTPSIVRDKVREAILLSGPLAGKFDIAVTMSGGGIVGQADAARLAVAKGLVAITGDEELRKTYLEYDRAMLVADPRRKETRKPGPSKARSAAQKSKR